MASISTARKCTSIRAARARGCGALYWVDSGLRRTQEFVDRMGMKNLSVTATIAGGQVVRFSFSVTARASGRRLPKTAHKVPTNRRVNRRGRTRDFEREIQPMFKLRLRRLLAPCDIENGSLTLEVIDGVVHWTEPAVRVLNCRDEEVELLSRLFQRADK